MQNIIVEKAIPFSLTPDSIDKQTRHCKSMYTQGKWTGKRTEPNVSDLTTENTVNTRGIFGSFEKSCFLLLRGSKTRGHLTTESVESAALSLQSVDNIHSSDGLTLGMLGVSNCITDDILEENFEYTSGLFVDESWDSLDTTTSSKSANSGLCDSLDVIPENLTMSLGSSFSQTFTTFASASHVDRWS